MSTALHPVFLPCAAGVEPLLADEVQAILGWRKPPATARGGVALQVDLASVMRLNLHSRLAQRVLLQVATSPYRSEDDLYVMARDVDWCAWITPQQTLRVDTSARQSPLRSLNFATLRIKDAVCDVLRDATGERPSVDTRFPHLSLALHLEPDTATLYVDTSGEPLFKRGWRDARGFKGEAPLKETLAAAMLAAAGWHGRAEDGALLDPCCGAGTIAIEAAQIACGMAPGLKRRFGFEALAPFASLGGAWQQMKQDAQAAVHPPAVAVFAGDVSFRMTDFAQRNAERAGVGQAIQFKTADALQRPTPADRGTMMLNPPYGERIAPKGRGARGPAPDDAPREARSGRESAEGAENIDAFFSQLAAHWKRAYPGWTAWVLSPDAKLPGRMRLKESRRVPLWNGPIECRLLRFDLVAGSNRGP
ncbi:putative N6-adenine-specific DNA methylase [Burkholderiales bacterium JOSHI_001]|nr:putative N6-adenine-specific DNA methylase [Burkholderiales bacterium JOSHI_001]